MPITDQPAAAAHDPFDHHEEVARKGAIEDASETNRSPAADSRRGRVLLLATTGGI
ncbi:hypothetical protein [Bradyrhizobium sp. 170]|uniref:hypothetical protein n=1 Tax=Bradyrhizobium sp. 170 TaxID=2782641 RepID=UPI001FFF82BE|nr:hypothetical protein [Bradyrhizobium sp. 170]UPK02837.1 hypothetical protein IVB05_35605 [Bradyrhizobium sp. 170]